MMIPAPFNFSGTRNQIEVENDSLRTLDSERPSAQIWPQGSRRQKSLFLFNLRRAGSTDLNAACRDLLCPANQCENGGATLDAADPITLVPLLAAQPKRREVEKTRQDCVRPVDMFHTSQRRSFLGACQPGDPQPYIKTVGSCLVSYDQ
jgi:hypothetical protein